MVSDCVWTVKSASAFMVQRCKAVRYTRVHQPHCVPAMSAPSEVQESFLRKLYRYAFFGWMLEQPHGDIYLRNSLRTRNREMLARWLPHYLRVHAVGAALCSLLLWLVLSLEADQVLVALVACADGAEICLALGMLSALVALKLQELAGDRD